MGYSALLILFVIMESSFIDNVPRRNMNMMAYQFTLHCQNDRDNGGLENLT